MEHESSLNQAQAAARNAARALNDCGNALLVLGLPEEALRCYDQAAAVSPPNAAIFINRGIALRALKRHSETFDCFLKALTLAPQSALSYNCLASALLDLNRPFEALTLYNQAIALDPHYVEALANRASALAVLKRPEEALASCDAALALAPGHVDALINRGANLTSLGRESEALLSYDAAIANAPAAALAHENKGIALLQCGRLDEAATALETALALEPSCARAYHHLSLARSLRPGERFVADLETMVGADAPTSPHDQVYAHFALGKTYADVSDHRRSFGHFAAGNAIKRKLGGYDEDAVIGLLGRSRLAYAEGLIERLGGGGPASSVPVFVLGMPRSGTTLVEQMLASHPSVYGAGETNDLEIAAREIGDVTAALLSAPESVWRMRPEDFRPLGDAYLARVGSRAGGAQRIVNKMTENFRCAGLIALALPGARIIHIRRDPFDTCFSCFTNLFVENHPYAYDLAELGRYYRAYETLMAHWRRVLPPGMMLEVEYEDVVADLEGEGRRVLAHCGLDWDPRCLDFHKTKRSVRTASVAQVRQPINPRSIGRWRAYEAFLGPLIEALGPREIAALHPTVSTQAA